ncbi:MAG: pre-mycofactocin synthase MftD [Candidatus Nanopelagicales bacterium]|jgi:heme/flavin dehydrogenase (mycofactocin system)|nr:mycofactocin biosynthesis FMN-dependent deaminase MftD [Candidatus Nanopelagicales bacterium]
MSAKWMETVAEAQRQAQRRLPPSVYSALLAGNEQGVSYRDNTDAFAELGLAPCVADLSSTRELSTTVMGQEISMPVMISPTGVQAVHPDGELAIGRAAAARGVAMGLSSFGSKPIEDVIATNPQLFFQLYWMDNRDALEAILNRAKAAGAKGLIVTLDWSFSYGRDWGSPSIPEQIDLKAMLQFAPEALRRPGWFYGFLKSGKIPDLKTPNIALPGEETPTFFGAYGRWMQTTPPTWSDLAWLVEQWDGPVMLKGISRPDDARRAVDAGFHTISVSNHGGNNLDTTPAAIRWLPLVADAVSGQIEIVLDGGIRRGSDVIKSLALGARAVMIGRAYLWGLAANGQAGVENVLDILRMGADSTLYGIGHRSIHDLSPDDVIVPKDFSPSWNK